MKKDEAERAIRHLCGQWGNLTGTAPDPSAQPDFGAFFSWVQKNYSDCLSFRTTTSVRDNVEQWFDQEFKQTWRN